MNMIEEYISYKKKRMLKYALLFFDDSQFIKDILERILVLYTNFIFYHQLETLEVCDVFDMNQFQLELDGLKVELLEDYQDQELAVSNEEYTTNRKMIIDSFEVMKFLCEVDFTFPFDETVSEEYLRDSFHKNEMLSKLIGSSTHDLAMLYKETKKTEEKFFKEDNDYYGISFIKLDQALYYTTLVSQIKLLDIHYKPHLVKRVFQQDKLHKDKLEILIQKLSMHLLLRFLRKEEIDQYIVLIHSNLFMRGHFVLEEQFNNPFLKRYLILMCSYDTYQKHSEFFDPYRLCCHLDLKYINDVNEKLNILNSLHIYEYVIIYDFKDKDYDAIDRYEGEFKKFIRREVNS